MTPAKTASELRALDPVNGASGSEAASLFDLETGSDEERCWRGEWLSRLMFGWMVGQRDPGTYEQWLTANGARLV